MQRDKHKHIQLRTQFSKAIYVSIIRLTHKCILTWWWAVKVETCSTNETHTWPCPLLYTQLLVHCLPWIQNLKRHST